MTHNALDSVPNCREQTVEDSGLLECRYALLGASGTYCLHCQGVVKSV